MMRYRLDNRGSATIEAAIIVPFLILLFASIIFLAFFLYDKCALERAASMAALRGSQAIWEDNSIRYQRTDEGITNILNNALLGAQEVEKQIKVEGNQIKVCLEIQYHGWNFQAEAEKKVINPTEFVRNCRKVKGVIDKEQ